MEIAVETHFHAQHGTKTIAVFLPADGGLLVTTSKFDIVQPENTYSCILKVTGEV